VQPRHVVDEILLILALSDEDGRPWDLGCRPAKFGQGVQEGGLAGIGEADQLDASDLALLDVFL
jgi:hypothetical protein